MKILVAEDDLSLGRLLQTLIRKWGYDPLVVTDGEQAWEALKKPDPFRIAVMDWEMPKLSGLDVCRKLRAPEVGSMAYIILLTVRNREKDIVEGLSAGANDYVVKPFKTEELRARIMVGERVVRLQHALVNQVAELRQAVSHIRTLQDVLPVCTKCRKVRDNEQVWDRFNQYLARHWEEGAGQVLCADCREDGPKD